MIMKFSVLAVGVTVAVVAVTISSTTFVVHALPEYALRIPNGYSVPNPGPQGGVWAGVGHENAAGGGPNNPFGLDFQAQGHVWTTELCERDSDGDGRSNGLELGDPDCVWFEGGPPPAGPAVSHPGIIDEPKGEDEIKGSCDDYVQPDDETTLDLIFTQPSSIDDTQTHYICEQKTVDVSQFTGTVQHQIKESVLLDNSNVLHHMFVYLCPPGAQSSDGNRVDQGQYSCSGVEIGCTRIAGWAVGPREQCLPPTVGELRDFTDVGQWTIKIEAHYDNTSGRPQVDQSGMRIHMTQTLRPLESATVVTGMVHMDNNFQIPPGQKDYPIVNVCPTAITQNLQHPVYVYSFYPHMHLYGRTLVSDLYRCGRKVAEVGRIDSYEFDNQQAYNLPRPVKILPGDALVTTCTFDSSTVNQTIVGGEETLDEMCLNFLGVYPDPRSVSSDSFFDTCVSFENGVVVEEGSGFPNAASTMRFAIGSQEASAASFTLFFESDPTLNIGSCCSAGNDNACEEMYIASFGEACGIDADCVGDFVCLGGLCGEPAVSTDESTEIGGQELEGGENNPSDVGNDNEDDGENGNEETSGSTNHDKSSYFILLVPTGVWMLATITI